MADRFRLDDAVLGDAGDLLVAAGQHLFADNTSLPSSGGFASVTGIGGQVHAYLQAVAVARNALADAAKTASQAVADLMQESGELEASITENLYGGFAVSSPGQRRSGSR